MRASPQNGSDPIARFGVAKPATFRSDRPDPSPLKKRLLGMTKTMDLQSLIMLIISALTAVYLFYALLRPEKF
jgi:K+-transporting ATPase KdpF subunit